MGNCLAVQWLRCGTFTTIGLESIPGQGTKISEALWHHKKKKKKKKKNQLWLIPLEILFSDTSTPSFRGSYGTDMASPILGSGRQSHWYSQKEFKF